jgi:hypothetical protein
MAAMRSRLARKTGCDSEQGSVRLENEAVVGWDHPNQVPAASQRGLGIADIARRVLAS